MRLTLYYAVIIYTASIGEVMSEVKFWDLDSYPLPCGWCSCSSLDRYPLPNGSVSFRLSEMILTSEHLSETQKMGGRDG